MAIIDQSNNSKLGLIRNGFNPQPGNAAWGYADPTANLDPAVSKLQNTYSVDSNPQIRLKDFNKNGISTIRAESQLDELDNRAPNLTPNTGVVSQVYKSKSGRTYKDLGPSDGRY